MTDGAPIERVCRATARLQQLKASGFKNKTHIRFTSATGPDVGIARRSRLDERREGDVEVHRDRD